MRLAALPLLLVCLETACCYQRATRPRIDNLTASEARYAELYWASKPAHRVVRVPHAHGGTASAHSRVNLGYRFIVPLPERLAGLTYVGHAARLRLALERARKGEALRVGALGGSITYGQGAGGPDVTYAAQFVEWLNTAMPPLQAAASTGGGGAAAASASGSAVLPGGPADSSRGLVDVPPDVLPAAAAGAAAAATVVRPGDGRKELRRARRETRRLAEGAARAREALGRPGRKGAPAGADATGGGGSGNGSGVAAVAADEAGAAGGLKGREQRASSAGPVARQKQRRRRPGAGDEGARVGRSAGKRLAAGDAGGGGGGAQAGGATPGGAAGFSSTAGSRQGGGRRQLHGRARALQAAGPAPSAAGGGNSPAPAATPAPRSAAATSVAKAKAAPAAAAAAAAPRAGSQFPAVPANATAAANATVPVPVARHVYVCGAVPGTLSGYMSSCMQHHLPPHVDIVLLEYAVNDPPLPSATLSERRAFERLVRKVLRLPSRPAVLLVNMYAALAARGRYWYNAERDFNEIASYYGLPSVSLKAAVLPSAATGSAPAVSLGAIFNGGKHHPGRGGHVVAAELLITLATELLASNARLSADSSSSGGGGDGSNSGSVSGGGGGGGLALLHGQPDAAGGGAGLSAAAAAALAAVASRPLPGPLAEGNYEATNSTCYIEHELQAIVQAPVEGWNWTDEGRGKWGWVALEAGRSLRIRVNTQLPGTTTGGAQASAQTEGAPIILQLAYLQSYSGMGAARVTCESGCSCGNATIDAQDARRVSVTSIRDLQVSQHPACVLQLTTLGPGSQAAVHAAQAEGGEGGGNKFKLMGVVVGEEPGASEGGVTWLRSESHEMANLMRGMRTPPPGSAGTSPEYAHAHAGS